MSLGTSNKINEFSSGRQNVAEAADSLSACNNAAVGDFSFGGNTVVCSSGSPELAVTPLVEIGVVLRQTREACSMTLREVAETLNIFERHLRKLEAGELPDVALTFARGYLKNYASFLKLDSDFIVHSFDLQTRTKTDVELTEACDLNIDNARVDIGRAVQSPIVILQVLLQKALGGRSSWSNDGFQSPFNLLNAVTSAALPLLLLCVVAVAYYSVDAERLESENTVIASMQSPSASPEQLGPLANEAIASASNTSPSHIVESSRVTASNTVAMAVNDKNAKERIATAIAYPAELDASTRYNERELAANTTSQVRATGVITLGAMQSGNTSRAVVPGVSIEDSYEPVGPGAVEMISQLQTADRLVITVYEDSWIDVRDNSGARLYRNLARAGRRIDVSGQLPFALHVGNVPGLEMRLNGEPVKVTRYRSDNSARLTLASNN